MIRILVADASVRITENILKRLAMESEFVVAGTARDGEQAVQEALRLQPDVVLVDADTPTLDGVQVTELLAQNLPQTGVIMMSMDGENEAIRHAMLAGAREFLLKPFRGDELIAAIRRVNTFEKRKQVLPHAGDVAPESAAAAPATRHPGIATAATETPGRGHVVIMLSGKGGVGTSVLTVNLALALASGGRYRVGIVDLSLQFGDIGALLNIDHAHTIADLAANDAVADPEVLDQVLAQGPGTTRVLLAPISPELADLVTTAHLRALMEEMRRRFDFVIVDTPVYLNEITLDSVEMSDQVVLITDPSVPGVKNTRLVLQVLEVLRVDPTAVHIVLNSRDAGGGLDKSYIESFLKRTVPTEIPHDAMIVGGSVTSGTPFLMSHPDLPVSRAVRQLAAELAPGVETPASAAPDAKRRSRRLLGFARG